MLFLEFLLLYKTLWFLSNQSEHEEENTKVQMNADVLLIGTSIIKDIDTQRMSNETIVKKHVLKQKTIEGALKFISNLEGNIKCFCYK